MLVNTTTKKYNYFRDYDPVTGRYIESDPTGLYCGLNIYGYVGGNPLHLIDPLGLLSEAVKKCVCNYMKKSGYSCTLAQGRAFNEMAQGVWDDNVLRPCENYLYAFAAVVDYGDNRYMGYAGATIHTALKPYRFWLGEIQRFLKVRPTLGSSAPSMEAYLAALEGSKDAGRRDWRKECIE